MPKSKNKNTESFNDLLKRLIEEKPKDERKKEQIRERKYYLIVCEGEKTEPNYFQSFQKHLPPKVQTIKIVGEGKNTIDVVERAIELKKERMENVALPNFNESWAIYDRDSFPKERVNAAFDLARRNNISNGFSNEAFELWYILHFNFLDTPNTREQYIDILNNIFLDKIGKKYAKNSEDIYSVLETHGNQNLAHRYAKKLSNQFKNNLPSDSKPSTTIHKLVKSLNEHFFKKT